MEMMVDSLEWCQQKKKCA